MFNESHFIIYLEDKFFSLFSVSYIRTGRACNKRNPPYVWKISGFYPVGPVCGLFRQFRLFVTRSNHKRHVPVQCRIETDSFAIRNTHGEVYFAEYYRL
jgi:hypothetical protein